MVPGGLIGFWGLMALGVSLSTIILAYFGILDTVDLLGVFGTSILVRLIIFSSQLASWNELLTFGVPRFSMAIGR